MTTRLDNIREMLINEPTCHHLWTSATSAANCALSLDMVNDRQEETVTQRMRRLDGYKGQVAPHLRTKVAPFHLPAHQKRNM
jgi:hypothetical protein